MDFELLRRAPRNCRPSCSASWTSTSIRTRRATGHEIEANTKAGKRWTPLQLIEELKPKARAQGLWNLFLPQSATGRRDVTSDHGAGLSNLDYAPLAEIMGRVPWASEVFNCSAPDTGNMETIERYGSAEHKAALAQAPARRRDPLAPSP